MAMLQSLTRVSLRVFAALLGLGLLGYLVLARRPGGHLEASAGSRLGLSPDYHSGRVLSVAQDLCLATDVYV